MPDPHATVCPDGNTRCDGTDLLHGAWCARGELPGPANPPECDYCGDDFLNPLRGYKNGCEKHDPFLRRRRDADLIDNSYAIARAVIRRGKGMDVETALLSLDHLYAAAKKGLWP